MLKIYNINKLPENYNSYLSDDLNFDYYEDDISNKKIECIIYWYASEPYSGVGEMIVLKDKKWHTKNLAHCSCFDGLDGFNDIFMDKCYNNLEELINDMSEYYKEDYIDIVNFAKNKGYK